MTWCGTRRDVLAIAGTIGGVSLAGCLGATTEGRPTNGGCSGEQRTIDVPILGTPNAATSVVSYEDFGCPHCKRYVEGVFPTIRRGYIEPAAAGDVAPDEAVATYNGLLDDAPDIIRQRSVDHPENRHRLLQLYEIGTEQLANEVIELHVTTNDGDSILCTVQTGNDAQIVAYEEGTSVDQPTMRIITDETTLQEIADADDLAATALGAYERGDIVIEGTDATTMFQVALLEAGTDAIDGAH